MRFDRISLIVLDSVGIGELPDANQFGDEGAHTIGHIIEHVEPFTLPNMRKLGLDCITELPGWKPEGATEGYYGKMTEVSVGKDTMTGHWEIAGLKVTVPFRTFEHGFPQELIIAFEQRTGRSVIGNKPASGTEILDELGEEHLRTGAWIVYTSADSVFQIAANEDLIPLDELYRACEIARELTMDERYAVGRVIARPFKGSRAGAFKRTSNRHDYAVKPPEPTVLDSLKAAGLDVIAVGKIRDIFDGEGITQASPTVSNEDGIEKTAAYLDSSFKGLLFTNLVDFDSLYGHRRDPLGYARALEVFDRALPDLMARIGERDLLMVTADHGNDPVHHGTDHTREYVPLLIFSPSFQESGSLGVRATFADISATIADNFGIPGTGNGTSMLSMLK